MSPAFPTDLPAPVPIQAADVPRSWILLLLIVVAGLGLRLYHLDAQSVWYDEASSIVASQGTLEQLKTRMIDASSHPPGHYYLLFGAFKVLGFGTWQARFVSVVFGTAAIGMLYVLASTLFDRRTGLVSAALLATSQIGLFYSQEARPYAVLLFLSVWTQLLFVQAARSPQLWRWCLFTLVATAMVYTHYYGLFVVAAIIPFWLLTRTRSSIPPWWWVASALLGIGLLAPWLLGGMRAQLAHWVPIAVRGDLPVWFRVTWSTPGQMLNMFNNGKFSGVLDSAPAWTFITGAAVYTLPAVAGAWSAWRSSGTVFARGRDAVIFTLLGLLVPIVAVLALALRGVVYDIRYVSFCIAPYYILVAHGLTRIPQTGVRAACAAVAIAYGCVALRANYTIPYKENYRDALAYVSAESRPGDVYVFEPYGLPLQWQVYHGEHTTLPAATLEDIEKTGASTGRVWLIAYTRTKHGEQRAREAIGRLQRKYAVLATRRYFWVEVTVFESSRASSTTFSEASLPQDRI